MRTFMLAAVVMFAFGTGCKKESEPAKTEPVADKTPPPPPPAKADAPPATPVDDDGLAGTNKMMHCPTAVENATTTITDSKDGVVIVVAAKDAKDQLTIDEIRKRAKHMAEVSTKDPAEAQHTGTGTGGGGLGRCAVIVADTKVTVADDKAGAKITVAATDPAKAADLQKMARERQQELEARGVGGTGGGSGGGTGAGGHGGGGGATGGDPTGGHGSGTGGGSGGGGTMKPEAPKEPAPTK